MKILFITYNFIQTASCRYRAYFPARGINQQSDLSWSAETKLVYHLTKNDIRHADVIVFQRIPQAIWYLKKLKLPFSALLQSRINALVDFSLNQNKLTCADIDDYIFFDENEFSTRVENSFFSYLIKKCHLVITSTSNLAKYVSTINKNVATLPNALDLNSLKLFETQPSYFQTQAILHQINKWKTDGLVVAGWVCGNARTKDFELFKSLLCALQGKSISKKIRFLLIGQKKWFQNNSVSSPLIYATSTISWQQLPFIQKSLDINLSLLADDTFNQYKSEIKFIEPGYFGVPSICSKIGIANEVISQHSNGLLASDTQDFTHHLEALLDSSKRRHLGANMRRLVIQNYNLGKRAVEYLKLFESEKSFLS